VRDEIEQLHDQIYPTGETQADRALEAIARHAMRIGSLTARAAGALVGGLCGDEREENLRGIQSDANGSAKRLRLRLAESRDGWNLLSGHECVANLEGHMLWHVYGVDDLVKEYFRMRWSSCGRGSIRKSACQLRIVGVTRRSTFCTSGHYRMDFSS
jgi:hypothetical protein